MIIDLTFFQIILTGIAILFLGNGLWKFVKRERGQTFFKVLYTGIIWGGIIFLILFPDFPRKLSVRLGLGESLNVLIFIGFVLVFMAIFKLLNSIERVEQTISALIRKQALEDLEEVIPDKDEKK
jgi:hypothetical protein